MKDWKYLVARDDGFNFLAAERARSALEAVGTFDASTMATGVETAYHRILEANLTQVFFTKHAGLHQQLVVARL